MSIKLLSKKHFKSDLQLEFTALEHIYLEINTIISDWHENENYFHRYNYSLNGVERASSTNKCIIMYAFYYYYYYYY